MFFVIAAVIVAVALGILAAKRGPKALPGAAVVADYERLGAAYHSTCVPYKLFVALGKTPPPDEERRHDAAMRAYADFMLGLDDAGVTSLVMHLDARAREAGNVEAPFEHVCEFLHEELERIRRDRRAVDDHRYRFGLFFIPHSHPALYVPYRPKIRAQRTENRV